jgi:hypothetical protein
MRREKPIFSTAKFRRPANRNRRYRCNLLDPKPAGGVGPYRHLWQSRRMREQSFRSQTQGPCVNSASNVRAATMSPDWPLATPARRCRPVRSRPSQPARHRRPSDADDHNGQYLRSNLNDRGEGGRPDPWPCWCRHRFDSGCRFSLTQHHCGEARSAQRRLTDCPRAVKVGTMGVKGWSPATHTRLLHSGGFSPVSRIRRVHRSKSCASQSRMAAPSVKA